MIYIGFIVSMGVCLYLTVFSVLVSWNNFGKYNMGGVPNRKRDSVPAIVLWVITCAAWYATFVFGPVTLR